MRIKHGKKVLDECVWEKKRGKKLWGRKSGEESKGKEMRGREKEIRAWEGCEEGRSKNM